MWTAAAEAQEAIDALQAKLAASRNEMAMARDDVRAAHLAEQGAYLKYENEVAAHQRIESEKDEMKKEVEQARRARDLAI